MRSKAVFLLIGMFLCVQAASAEDAKYDYTGAKKCKICHSTDKKSGTHYKVWLEKKHAKAFETLASDKAKEAAAKRGIADPQKDETCLACHTTKAVLEPKDKITHKEGVSCEACHGPAKEYLKPHGKEGYEAGVALGMKALRTMTIEEKTAICAKCHKEDPANDFYKEFNYEEAWAKIEHTSATSQKVLDSRKEK